MAEYQVWYTVPVACHVDTETGEVLRAVVIDEMIKLDPSEGVTLPDYSAKAPEEDAPRAIEIAETGDWPVWENGY